MTVPIKPSYLNTRALATQLIFEVLSRGRSLRETLPIYKARCKSKEDAGFVQALTFGVLRFFPRFQFIANQLLEKHLKEKDNDVLYLITVGLFQLIHLETPPHAAISETVEAARLLKKPWSTGLVNAILRSYLRQASTLQDKIQQDEEAYYAHPHWLIQAIKTAWPKHWEFILNNNNSEPPLCLRVNLQKETRDHYLKRLNEVAVLAEPLPATEAGVLLKSAGDITMLPGFEKGFFSVQDGAAQLAAPLLELSPNLRVLDACAAPGGKTCHILELEPNLKEVVALDIAEMRSKIISENLQRLQLKATVITADASKPETWWDNVYFDRILLDPPCSASGVIRRHPDIKYLRKLSDITKLNAQQLELLNSLWPLLKPGGILVYATCSIFPEENVNIMQEFLKVQKDAVPLPFSIPGGIQQSVGYQLLSGQNEMDGFYYARLGKSKP